MSILTIENLAGDSIQAGAQKITPVSQVVRLRFPGMQGGLVWNRPHSVRVQAADGSERVLPVDDVTRLTQLSLLALGLLGGLLVWLISRR